MKINLKESLNELDIISDNRYDLYNTYLAKNPSNDLKKKIAEAIYNNRSPKEILMIINEKWDDAAWHDTADQEQVDQPDYVPDTVDEWEVMDHKSVKDSDGFITDYTWYKNSNTGEHVFVFGDSDLYGPEDGWYDWECDSDEEAEEWFDNYKGPGDDEDDWMDESLNESNDSKVFVVKTLQNYPYNGWIELMDKIDENGEGEKHRFYDRKKLDDFAKELVKQGYKNYQGYSKNNKNMKNEALYDDIYHDFRVARENWKKLNLNIDFDSALDEWNKKSKLADPKNQSKPIYNKEAWNDMISMFSNKNESLKEDTRERILHISKKKEPELKDRNSVWIQVKDENEIEKYFRTALRMSPDKIVIHDFDVDEIPKKLLTLSKSVEIPVSFDESLKEDMVKVEPTEKELNQVINVLNKYGFKVDDNYKPGRGLFGSYHIQVINPDLDYIDFDQLVKDVEPVGNALDNLSFDINLPITYNFGANDDNVITGGIDIHVGYKDDSDLTESITYPNGKEASDIDIHKALNYMYGEDRDMNDDS